MSEGKRMALIVAAGVLVMLGLEVGYSLALAPYEIRSAPGRAQAKGPSFFKGPITSTLFGRS
jgi:hypothetical protein